MIRDLCARVIRPYRPLLHAQRELYLLYLLKFCESFAYFSLSVTLVVWLSAEFGYSDAEAGWIYGLFGVITSALSLTTSALVDFAGVRVALIAGAGVSAISRCALVFVQSRGWLLFHLLFLLPAGVSLGMPVMTVGIKRYTRAADRTAALGLFYAVMNVAALVAGVGVDALRETVGGGVVLFGRELSVFRVVILAGAVVTIVMVVIALFFRDVVVAEDGTVAAHTRETASWRAFAALFRESRFWRMLLFALLITVVKMSFRHLDATLPKTLLHELGDDVPYGTIYAINPALIIVLVPIIAALTQHVRHLTMIVWGSLVSSLALFALAIEVEVWSACVFVVLLSLGEAFYSPRVYSLFLTYAPDGREGLYMGGAHIPTFTAKLLAGGVSGELIQEYCPEDPPRRCEFMWLIIGLSTIWAPLAMLALRGVLQPPELVAIEERERKRALGGDEEELLERDVGGRRHESDSEEDDDP